MLPDSYQSAYLYETPFFTALNFDVGVTYGRAYLHHRTEPTEQTFNESEVPARNSPVTRSETGTVLTAAIRGLEAKFGMVDNILPYLVTFIIKNNSWVYAMGLHNPCSVPFQPLYD